MILATSKVVKIVCLQWFYLWYKVNIFTSEPACKWSWMATLYFKFQWSTKSASIKWPKWWHNQWTRLPSTIFRSILCLELLFFLFFCFWGVFLFSFVFVFVWGGMYISLPFRFIYAERRTACKTHISVKECLF